MANHPGLAEREREEDAEDVELDQARYLGVERDDQQAGDQGEQDDPVGEHQPVAAVGELMRQVVVAPEQRREHRESR